MSMAAITVKLITELFFESTQPTSLMGIKLSQQLVFTGLEELFVVRTKTDLFHKTGIGMNGLVFIL